MGEFFSNWKQVFIKDTNSNLWIINGITITIQIYLYIPGNEKCPTCLYNLSLSQIFREPLLVLLQILSIMTTLSHYMDSDCIKVRKKMTIFYNYWSWESYNIVPKKSLPEWMDNEDVENFWIYRICLKHSSVYIIFNLKKMETVHHKQHSTNKNQMRHFRKWSS